MDYKMTPQGICVYCFSIFVSNMIIFLWFSSGFPPCLLSHAVCSKSTGHAETTLSPSAAGGLAQLSLARTERTTLLARSTGKYRSVLYLFINDCRKFTSKESSISRWKRGWQADPLRKETHLPPSFCAWPNATCMKRTRENLLEKTIRWSRLPLLAHSA